MTGRDLTLDTDAGTIAVTMTPLEGDADATLERLVALLGAATGDVQDRSDAVTVTWTPAGRKQRRYEFEPNSDGGWSRIEREMRLGGWEFVGSEGVESVRIEHGDAVVVDR
jgi:hypothetical protein